MRGFSLPSSRENAYLLKNSPTVVVGYSLSPAGNIRSNEQEGPLQMALGSHHLQGPYLHLDKAGCRVSRRNVTGPSLTSASFIIRKRLRSRSQVRRVRAGL